LRWGSSARWAPGLVALAATVGWLAFYGVPALTSARFLAYLALVTAPGTLLWRLVRRAGPLPVDLAAGAAVGYAIETLTYILGRWLGFPLLPLVPLLGIVAGCALLRRSALRGPTAPDGAARMPVGVGWALTGVWLALLLWSVKYVRYTGLRWPSYGAPDTDLPFHLGLLGEAKHHMPLTTPWVSGEPVLYHWFVYADLASAGWITGIEPFLLLTRLAPLPFLAGFVVLGAALAHRLTGRWWTGPAAVVATFFLIAPNPYGWGLWSPLAEFGFSPYEDGSLLRLVLWTSPTQTFGTLLFAPLVWVTLDLVEQERTAPRAAWPLFGLLCVAVMGAKATYLPLLLVALLVTAAVRRSRAALLAAGFTALCVGFAALVLFGGSGAAQGLGLAPLDTVRTSAAPLTVGLNTVTGVRLLVLTAVLLFCWACLWGFAAVRPHPLLAGLGLAGGAAVLLFSQSGGSQGFFLQSARPYLAIAAVAAVRFTHRTLAVVALVAGFAVVRVVRAVTGGPPPVGVVALVWPYALLAVMVLVVGVVFLRRPGVVAAFAAGLCLFGTYARYSSLVSQAHREGWHEVAAAKPFITRGTPQAGRWLRDHSSPNDLVATNAHCVPQNDHTRCYNVHFAVAAYTERRVLVEGWGFTPRAHLDAERAHDNVNFVPFWNPQLLRANDAAFTDPDPSTIGVLRDRYHVRWMFVDESVGRPAPVTRPAVLRFRAGQCAVYEILQG
jgi:hypothetical protein